MIHHYWTEERVTAWLKGFYAREAAARGVKAGHTAYHTFIDLAFPTIHCTVCGEQIVRQGQGHETWGRVRKCQRCKAEDRQAGAVKYCRLCGTTLMRPEIPEGSAGRSLRVGWSTVATCEGCRGLTDLVVVQARKYANEARKTAPKAYLDGLSEPLRKRIRHS